MRKIRKGDQVIMLAGKDKGQRGTIARILAQRDRVFVTGVNIARKHQRPDPNRQIQGGIIEKEMSVHVSNVAIYNSKTGKADRIGFKFTENDRKVRHFKSSGELIDV